VVADASQAAQVLLSEELMLRLRGRRDRSGKTPFVVDIIHFQTPSTTWDTVMCRGEQAFRVQV
jgi:hypothetical protein